MKTISIVIPALNEEGNIRATIDAVSCAAREFVDDYEIIVVNDGSSDRTPEIVYDCSKANPRIRMITHEKPKGFGASYNAGRRDAMMKYCMMVHGDNAFPSETLARLFQHAGKTDIVCGFIANPQARTKTRQLISALYTRILNVLFGLKLRYYNGLQIHETEWLKAQELESAGFGFQAELLIKGIGAGRSYIEVPTYHQERPGGGKTKAFRIRNVIQVVTTILSIYGSERNRILHLGATRRA